MHKCKELSTILVSVDPQLVGYLMQRMIRAGLVTQVYTYYTAVHVYSGTSFVKDTPE